MKWNEQQRAIFSAIADTDSNLVIKALAGTGKTTTIVEGLNHIPTAAKTLFCAFNKAIAKQLEKQCPSHVQVKTLHSLGLGCLYAKLGGDFEIDSEGNKVREIVRNVCKNILDEDTAKRKLIANGKTPDSPITLGGMGWHHIGRDKQREMGTLGRPAGGAVSRLVSLGKNTLAESEKQLVAVAQSHGIDDLGLPAEELAYVAKIIIDECAEQLGLIDFDDMIWLPARLQLKPRRFDVVFVDEAQDLNAAQLYLIEQAARSVKGRTSRLVAVGDNNQAIYAWRGAGAGVLDALADKFSATVLTLPVTFRCAAKIVAEAQRIVPEFTAHPSTGEGEILNSSGTSSATAGDFILSRTNAPLISACLALLRQHKPATIAGRDVAGRLIALIKRSKASTIDGLGEWLTKHEARCSKKFSDDEKRLKEVLDLVACVRAITEDLEGADQVDAAINKLNRLFTDRTSEQMIVCSTVHKAKGLERDRVWLLRDTFAFGRKPDEADQEERNLWYVAVSRAKSSLVMVA